MQRDPGAASSPPLEAVPEIADGLDQLYGELLGQGTMTDMVTARG